MNGPFGTVAWPLGAPASGLDCVSPVEPSWARAIAVADAATTATAKATSGAQARVLRLVNSLPFASGLADARCNRHVTCCASSTQLRPERGVVTRPTGKRPEPETAPAAIAVGAVREPIRKAGRPDRTRPGLPRPAPCPRARSQP